MKVLIGGGAGYIGTELVWNMVVNHPEFEITVIDLCWFGSNTLPEEVPLIKKDLFECTEEDFMGFDVFIFLAGLSNDPMADFSPMLNDKYNAKLPAHLGRLCKQARISKFIYASSCSVYGKGVGLLDESGAINCDFPYGTSKYEGEQAVLQLANETFRVISLRMGTVCGPSRRLRTDTVLNTMYANAMNTGVICVLYKGIHRPILNIRDAVMAYIYATQLSDIETGVYNIATFNVSIEDLANATGEILGDKKAKVVHYDRGTDKRDYQVNCEKAVRAGLLVVQKDRSVFEHIEFILLELHRWCQENNIDLKNPDLANVNVFKKISWGLHR